LVGRLPKSGDGAKKTSLVRLGGKAGMNSMAAPRKPAYEEIVLHSPRTDRDQHNKGKRERQPPQDPQADRGTPKEKPAHSCIAAAAKPHLKGLRLLVNPKKKFQPGLDSMTHQEGEKERPYHIAPNASKGGVRMCGELEGRRHLRSERDVDSVRAGRRGFFVLTLSHGWHRQRKLAFSVAYSSACG